MPPECEGCVYRQVDNEQWNGQPRCNVKASYMTTDGEEAVITCGVNARRRSIWKLVIYPIGLLMFTSVIKTDSIELTGYPERAACARINPIPPDVEMSGKSSSRLTSLLTIASSWLENAFFHEL